MAGICSRHRGKEPDCAACNSTPHDIFPDWDEKCEEAEAAGTHKCSGCGFVFYLTDADCPKCGCVARKYLPPSEKKGTEP